MALTVPDKIVIADEILLDPKVYKSFYAESNQNGVELGTSYAKLTWDTPTYLDTGFTESGGEISVTSVLNNARARIDFSLSCANANNNTVHLLLGIDPDGLSGYSPERGAANYVTDGGSVNSFYYVTLQTGMKIRVQAKITGSTGATIASIGTQISIETKPEILT